MLVFIGTILFGLSAGALGCFAFLRRRSLMGDALAHAALPGVCLAFLLTHGSKHPLVIILGAAVTAWLGSLALQVIVEKTRIKEDAALGLVLSVFFGIGIVLLTYIQHQDFGNQAGLDKFLFGQAAAMLPRDVIVFSALALLILVLVGLSYKELKVTSFDPEFAKVIGLPAKGIDHFLMLLLVLVVTAGLQSVGVVLMAALLITPAAAARLWTDRLFVMLVIAGVVGAASGFGGTLVSTLAPRMPTGPWIVLFVTALFAISFILAPNRGLLPRYWRTWKSRRRVAMENILRTLYRLQEDQPQIHHTIGTIRRYRHLSETRARRYLKTLAKMGWARELEGEAWELTDHGMKRARTLVRRHRLWEVYLSDYLKGENEDVHHDAETVEHVMTTQQEKELQTLLGRPTHDPHDKPIPYEDDDVKPKGDS